jgi:hypothetical protein
MSDILKEWWHVIAAAVGAVVFIIRMEGRTGQHAIEIARLWKQRDEDQASAQRSRTETHEKLDEVSRKLDRVIERLMK